MAAHFIDGSIPLFEFKRLFKVKQGNTGFFIYRWFR
jgi:hypothetical protein